jgi:hypothetical protein
MANFFPVPYEDEDLRSIIYRYSKLASHRYITETNRELFLHKHNMHLALFPSNLNLFFEFTSNYNSCNLSQIIYGHTFYPLFRIFLPLAESNLIYEQINSTGRVIVPHKLRSWINEKICYCPQCLTEDKEKYGEIYIHRFHQFDSLNICLKHHVLLIHSCQFCNKPLASADSQLNSTICVNCGGNLLSTKSSQGDKDQKILLLKILNELFFSSVKLNARYILDKLINKLGNHHYINFKGSIKKKELITEMIIFFGEEDLKKLNINSNSMLNKKGITKLFNEKFSENNITFYLLLIAWFFNDAKTFLEDDKEGFNFTLPFGTGPWECLNPVCSFYNQKHIAKVQRYVTKNITEVYKCPSCGFSYLRTSRTGQLPVDADYTIIEYGSQWLEHLFFLYEQGKTLKEISTEMCICFCQYLFEPERS